MLSPIFHRSAKFPVAASLVLTGILSLASAPAEAHQQYAPSTVNRYGKLIVSGQHRLRLLHTLMVGATPADGLRGTSDRNHDGRLDDSEQSQLCGELGRRIRDGVSLALDGQTLPLSWQAPQCTFSGTADKPSDSLGELPFSVELAAEIPFPAGPREHTLRYEDRVHAPPVGEVELRIEEGPDVTLLASWQGAAPTTTDPTPATVQRQFQSIGPARSSMSDRSISLRFTRADSQPPTSVPSRRGLLIAAAILLALVLLGGAHRVRRHAG